VSKKLPLSLLSVAAVCFAFTGCGNTVSKLNKTNYDRIRPGMTRTQVEEILGKGTNDNPGLGFGTPISLVWSEKTGEDRGEPPVYGGRWIRVGFVDGKVKSKTPGGIPGLETDLEIEVARCLIFYDLYLGK
jgi:hypothetical protein